MTTPTQLNDDIEINVTLPTPQWNVVLDWIAHAPFDEAREALKRLNEQIENINEDENKPFTASLPIRTFNMLIFCLGQGPYYMMAEPIQQIYSQGQAAIEKLREDAANVAKQLAERDVEKSDTGPDNSNIEQQPVVEQAEEQPVKPARKRRTARKTTKTEAE